MTRHEEKICGIGISDFIVQMEEFHGYRSPGLLLGGMMIDKVLEDLGQTPYLNIVTETVVCLPDAVQMLTPCTIGNGFLQVLDWGKFALTGYDRKSLVGVRAWIKQEVLQEYPHIHGWFERSKRGEGKPRFEDVAGEIIESGSRIIACKGVRLKKALKEGEHILTGSCSSCGESYALRLGSVCPACSGHGYYD
ncbi:MAG: formylmethanofuran dehydrogenase subunit E family protein [Deltaproteobacteria bacterium]|nr:formylmethanofuran dehydrogenase subunit E family protein [Deltaproteobacteria bacterium]